MKNIASIASVLLLACAVLSAHADTVTYSAVVNTSSQAGNGGYIDLSLLAGSLGAQDITATVTDFSGAVLNPSDPNNDAINTTGSLPGAVTFDNQSGNDYFEALTFGNNVDFLVTLSGAGLSASGDSTSSSGTTFAVAFYDPTISTVLFSDDPSGAAAQIQVAADGTTAIATQPGTTVVAETPEPSTLSLVGLGIIPVGAALRQRQLAHTA